MVSFRAVKAGAECAGCDRYYALERTTNLLSAPWFGVEGHTNTLGDGTRARYTVDTEDLPTFYRGRVWLE